MKFLLYNITIIKQKEILTMKITNELIESAKDFANKINAQFVSIEKNKYFEIVLKIIDENNKPKSIKFRRNP